MTKPIAPGMSSLSPSLSTIGSVRRMTQIDRTRVDPMILKAAEGMETLFLDYMMQAMRKTVPDNPMSLESNASRIYRGMLDSEYAEMAARRGGVGLADDIIAYLEASRYNLKGSKASSPLPGRSEKVERLRGSHEGRESADQSSDGE